MVISGNWWARRWEALMQEWGIAVAEARTTRAYRVKSLEVVPGGIMASVHDRDSGACKVEVQFETLREDQWERIGELISSQSLISSQLLSGAMPPEIEQIFAEVGAHLLPQSRTEFTTRCTRCLDATCRHLPLIFALFTEMLDNDPGLLFTLRGRYMQQLLRDVHDSRPSAGTALAGNGSVGLPQSVNGDAAFGVEATLEQAEVQTPAIATDLDQYWGNRALIRQFHHHIGPPAVELSLLRRLGPISASDESMGVYEQLVALYRRITDEALSLAYASDDEGDRSNGHD